MKRKNKTKTKGGGGALLGLTKSIYYYLPESHGGAPNLKAIVPKKEMEYARVQIVERAERNEYPKYFQRVLTACDSQRPTNWREGLELYNTLLD